MTPTASARAPQATFEGMRYRAGGGAPAAPHRDRALAAFPRDPALSGT